MIGLPNMIRKDYRSSPHRPSSTPPRSVRRASSGLVATALVVLLCVGCGDDDGSDVRNIGDGSGTGSGSGSGPASGPSTGSGSGSGR
jgi:hypothetical protein